MKNNVIYLRDANKSKLVIDANNVIDASHTHMVPKSDLDRAKRIKASLDRINKLMAELRKVGES